MKRSTILCASVVALAALAISTDCAFAQSQSTTVNTSRSNIKNNSETNQTTQFGGAKADKSSTINGSRSNNYRMGGGGGAATSGAGAGKTK
jgi:hypothetical protein